MKVSKSPGAWAIRSLMCLGLLTVVVSGYFFPLEAASKPTQEIHRGRNLDAAKQFITQIACQSVSVLQRTDRTDEQRRQAFEEIWYDGIAFKTIGRFVLGRHWRTATPDQQKSYQELFVASVMRTSVSVMSRFGDEQIQIIDARLAGKKDMLISTQFVRVAGPPIPVNWRVRVINERHQIIDVSVEGVSMALTKRSEYSSVVKNQGLEGLLEALRSSI